MLHTEQSGTPSAIFGGKFPYPIDGKSLIYEFASAFATEFNQRGKLALKESFGSAANWQDLYVTSAYPTTKQQCPRIAIIRQGSSPRNSGIGNEIDVRKIGDKEFRFVRGQIVTDTVEASICTLNERLRDDLFIWFQQYMIDAMYWTLPQLGGVFNIACTNGVDDQVEYQGMSAQPGFEFYVARLTYQVQYDLIVMSNVDELAAVFNWQQCIYANADT